MIRNKFPDTFRRYLLIIGGTRIDTRIDMRINIRIREVVDGAPTSKRGITVPDIQK